MNAADKMEQIGNIAEFKRGPFGSSIKKSVCVPKGSNTYKLYEQGNVINNDFQRGTYYITKEKFKELSHFEIKTGDLLLTCAGTLGKIAIVPEEIQQGIINSVLMRIRIDEKKVIRNYIYYYFQSPKIQNDISKQSAGVAIKNLFSTRLLKKYTLYLPDISEQELICKEIENQFSRLDEAVAALKRIKANLKRYKASVLKAAVEGKLTAEWRLKQKEEGRKIESGEQLLKRILAERRKKWEKEHPGKKYKEPAEPDTSNLPELPKGWVWVTVGQLAEVGTGATPLKSKRSYYDGGKVPWVTSGALNELFIRKAEDFITELAISETNAKVFPAHTLLVAMYGEGKTRGKVSELLLDAATNQACAAITFDEFSSTVRPYVKAFFLKNYDDIRRLSSGGVQPNLNLGQIKATVIPIPPATEQKHIISEIDSRLSVTEEIEVGIETNLKRAERLRQSILKKAFSGRLV